MVVFINDKPVAILDTKELAGHEPFEVEMDGRDPFPNSPKFVDDVLIRYPTEAFLIELLLTVKTRKLKHLSSITIVTEERDWVKDFIKSRFTIIKAAGGVVRKKDKVLFIHRLGKWDFPKGKFEKGETPDQCAVREVEEECGIKVKLGELICKTWHTYTLNRKSILKKTYWYAMDCVDDQQMVPQLEEGIDDVRWLNNTEALQALYNSYPSMRYLYKRFREQEVKV
ncbi:NUDIX hydrolase [Penaeicola halotolerans]|uniref:NUDIX hydrolase n=1 Tax=Penaeicola halotolerans TaxID=2793196 RepID=UPI001CF87B64|nr:NUDIX hydrolase [Penaeicola halotolerans]